MKTKKSFLWLAFLILATIWILVRHNQQVGYYSVKGLVFGTVYKITYQHDGDLKPEIEAELKRFDQSLSPFNDYLISGKCNGGFVLALTLTSPVYQIGIDLGD